MILNYMSEFEYANYIVIVGHPRNTANIQKCSTSAHIQTNMFKRQFNLLVVSRFLSALPQSFPKLQLCPNMTFRYDHMGLRKKIP